MGTSFAVCRAPRQARASRKGSKRAGHPGIAASVFFFVAFATLLSARTTLAACGVTNDGCSVFDPCCEHYSCHTSFTCYDEPRRQGQPCSSAFPCGPGLQCSDGLECIAYRQLGEACGLTYQCASGLSCGADNTCYHSPRQAGELCNAADPCADGLQCNDAFVCIAYRGVGESCGPFYQCAEGLTCHTNNVCYNAPRLEGQPCSAFDPCADDLQCSGDFECIKYRKSGDACGPFFRCETGLACWPFIQQCVPASQEPQLFPEDTCLALYSEAYHRTVQQSGLPQTVGVGVNAAIGVSGIAEFGSLYGADDRYGCYLTTCVGATTDAEVGAFACVGQIVDPAGYSAAAGSSIGIVADAGEIVVLSAAGYIDPNDRHTISTSECLSLEASLAPISVGAYDCTTLVKTYIGASPPVARCIASAPFCANDSTCDVPVNIDGGSYHPDGDQFTLSQSPLGPYSIGSRLVTLRAATDDGESDSCSTNVTVVDCRPPVVSCPAPTIAECTGPTGATVDPPAVNASDRCSSVSNYTDPPAALYPIGTTAVSYTATDAFGNMSGCASSVTVRDTTKPVVTCPAPTVVECTSVGGTNLNLPAVAASDTCSSISSRTDPPSTLYPLGTTSVAYAATDSAGNTASCSSSVTVEDTVKPVLALVGVVDPIECGVGTFDDPGARVSEVCDAGIADQIVLGTGTVDPATIGDYTVRYDVTDASGNVAVPISRVVTVVDRTPPQILCPADITVQPVAPEGRRVSIAAAAWSDDCDKRLPTPSCPQSNDWFGVGTETVVSCEVADATGGNSSSCSLTVTVLTEEEVVRTIREELEALLSAGRISQSLARRLNRRLWRIQSSIARDRLRTLCRQLDQWTAYVQRRLSASLTAEELARLLDPVANVRATVACPE